MKSFVSALVLLFVKYMAKIFYRFEVPFIGDSGSDPWRNVKLIVILNHTSLFEPLFLGVLPNHFLLKASKNLAAPGADKTLRRPIVGLFYRLMSPKMISISRKRDRTWNDFLKVIDPETIVIILPEGRMKRRTGLDAEGKPMTIRAGVADVLNVMNAGKMAITYSGGLHHIQAPGDLFPKLFKTIRANVEFLDIPTYKQSFSVRSLNEFKLAVVRDLEERMARYTPAPV